MRNYGDLTNRPLRPLVALLAILLLGSFAMLGCGSSDSSGESTQAAQEVQEETKESQEEQQVKKELQELKGSLNDCGMQVYANDRATCAFAKRIQNAYYGELTSGSGKVLALHPQTGRDHRLFCTGTVPHKCTDFNDDGEVLETYKGAVIFFSP